MKRHVLCLLSGALSLGLAAPVTAGERGAESYSPELKWVLLAPPGGSVVQVLDVSRGVTPLATLRSRARGPVVAMQAQLAGRRVWVLAGNGLDVHDGFSGRLLGHWAAPEGVRLDRLEVDGSGRPAAWSGTQAFEAVTGAAVLAPLGARLSLR